MQSNSPAPENGDPRNEGRALPTLAHVGAAAAGPVRISSQALFSGATEIEIEHKGALYRLRQTSLGKLILTK